MYPMSKVWPPNQHTHYGCDVNTATRQANTKTRNASNEINHVSMVPHNHRVYDIKPKNDATIAISYIFKYMQRFHRIRIQIIWINFMCQNHPISVVFADIDTVSRHFVFTFLWPIYLDSLQSVSRRGLLKQRKWKVKFQFRISGNKWNEITIFFKKRNFNQNQKISIFWLWRHGNSLIR